MLDVAFDILDLYCERFFKFCGIMNNFPFSGWESLSTVKKEKIGREHQGFTH